MAPVLLIVCSPFVLKEKLTARKAVCVAGALAGMLSLVLLREETGLSGILGAVLILGSTLFSEWKGKQRA